MSAIRFKVFHGKPEDVEAALNEWAASLPPGARIRRTQLAAGSPPAPLPGHFTISAVALYALVNYELPATAQEA